VSLTTLGSSFARAYATAPGTPVAGQRGGKAASPQPVVGTSATDLNALTSYIPSDILTLYIGALSAISATLGAT
jgi:hypothetical protein